MKEYKTVELIEISKMGGRICPKSALGKFLRIQTSWFNEKNKTFPRQRLWHIINNTKENPGCVICQNDVRWDDAQKAENQQYRKYCSKKCQMNDPEFQKQKRETEIKRYGIGREAIVEKIKKTNNERYGTDFAIQNEYFKEKKKKTCLKKYGVDNPIKLKTVVQTREQTNLDRFGLISFAKQHIHPDILNKLQNSTWLKTEHHDNKKSIITIAKELNVNYEIITRSLKRLNIPIIRYPSSALENDIVNYINDVYDGCVETNNKTLIHPQHLDVVIPEKHLAYEINGIYWHSELNGRMQNYHLNKSKSCNDANFNLIHINENDWIEKNNIVKSIISYSLNNDSITNTYARKCRIVEISSKHARNFFTENHIQGYRPCSINIALTHNDKVVSCMSFGKPRYNKKYEYELYRFCSALFTNVPGGASKILKHFINSYSPKSIITYSDKSRGRGDLYQKIGFDYSHSSTPNYWYFKSGTYTLFSRVKFQKHKLEKILTIYNPNISEWKNMQNNGYDRIWDCGNSVWVWNS